MSSRTAARPGGRSARVQQAVHRAVQELEDELGRKALTVPLVAERAGVTPSTIYRRWGDLQQLMADVAVERLRPEETPADLGGLREDLEAWAVQFMEEMSSSAGRGYIRDVISGDPESGDALRCSDYAAHQLTQISVRAAGRGEAVPAVEALLDAIVAPVMYRIMFRPGGLDAAFVSRLVAAAL